MAEDLHEFMEDRNIQLASLLGHSMGGKVAMCFAVQYPDLVDKLVVVDIAPKVYPPGHDDVFAALYSFNPSEANSRQETDAALARHLPDLALRQFLLKNLERDASGKFRWRINLDAIYASYHEMLRSLDPEKTFSNPVLFIKGENSDYIREGDSIMIHAIFPSAQIVAIPGAGHWVHAEAPQEFTRVVLDFLMTTD
jgi:pimeloyl-ACP methyl ester carboxylesterase